MIKSSVKALMGAGVLCGLLFSTPTSVQASDFCDIDTVLSSYKAALKRKNLGDEDSAFKSFLRLADIGVAPAQRHAALYYLEESREDMALEKAIMWARLAAWGGDKDAQKILKSAVESARHAVSEAGLAWANDWRPKKPDCFSADAPDDGDDDFKVIGRFPVIRSEGLDEDVFVQFGLRLEEALLITDQVAPILSPLADLIPAFEIIEGKGADRYVGWDIENGWLQVSSGYLRDKTSRQLSFALILATQRRLFDEIKDATFADQIASNYGAIKLYGSLYGDVKTDRFLSLLKEAIKNVRNLPVVMRDKVNLIDEIHYMPPSRYHLSRLGQEKSLARYDYLRSQPEKRIGVITRKLVFEESEDVILHLVRIGTQIQQHMMIEGFKGKVDGKKREDAILRALQGDMKAAQDMFTNQVGKQKELIEQWDKSGPEGVAKLNCEATFWQVKAAAALKMSQSKVARTIKFKGCKKARTAWKDYLNKKDN
ncbi:hypothetical protein RYZ26_03060 [Terasakiella sp. A23]|uniref:hypothetical protein n=1 Tax=Terasakiella sp. FCG-A23 TaxID=3080561 RepID=UPI002953EAA7|nr:hypothetical protein [Terasakiella sp. A23]MDV7338560.1 hypothetical protein [Terasakiella sp. A23]